MPGEYENHHGTIMIWPVRPGSWPYGGRAAKKVFTDIARTIAKGEQMYILAHGDGYSEATEVFADDTNIRVLDIPTDDAWARDMTPTFVRCIAADAKSDIRGIDWQFNAWGGDYDGLYAHYDKDNAAAGEVCRILDYDMYNKQDFVLEGGSIHSDGEGTILVTEACLLSKGRNPHMTKSEIENNLLESLGADKVIWLKRGIYNDETNEHVDNICAFTAPGEVVLAWTDDKDDPQYELSQSCYEILSNETDARGRSLVIHKLPIPKEPVLVKEEDLKGYIFEEGEDVREAGERLAASYVNFYISNKSILVPQFDDVNDAVALRILRECFEDREIVGIPARDIILGGGNIHCITQQIPE